MCSRGARSSARREVLNALRDMLRRDQCVMATPLDIIVYVVGWTTILYLLLALALAAMGVL